MAKSSWNESLKMYQRSCRTLHGLNDNLNVKLQEDILKNAKESDVLSVDGQSIDILENDSVTNTEEIVVLKRGVKLPKSTIEWSLANEYFKAVLSNQPISNEGLDSIIEQLNNTIFEYYRRTHCKVDRGDDVDLSTKYQLHTVTDLKRELKHLKQHNGNINEIKFVSRRLRNLLSIKSRSEQTVNTNIDHDKYIRNNFWRYVKNFLTRRSTVLFSDPTFNKDDSSSLRRVSQQPLLESVLPFLLGFLHYLSLMYHAILIHPHISKSQKLFAI